MANLGGTKIKKSIVGRIRNTMLASGAVIVIIMTLLAYNVMKKNLLSEIKSSVAEVATIAAAQVDGDAFATIAEGDDEAGTEAYEMIHSQLSTFLEGENTEYVYTMKQLEDGTIVFVVDTDPEEAAAAYEVYDEVADEMLEALEGNVTTDADITSDEWGSFLSAYAPIYNSSDEVVGFVGVDFLAESVDDKCNAFMNKMIAIDVVCIVLAVLAAILPASTLKKRLTQVNSKLSDVVYNDGDLTKQVDINTGDEFEVIAANLNAMLEQTRAVVSSVKQCSDKIHDVAVTVDGTMESAAGDIGRINDDLKCMGDSVALTVSSLEEIRAMIEETKQAVDAANDGTRCGADVVAEIRNRSRNMTDETENTQQELAAKMQSMQANLSEMLEKAETVDKISEFTDEILSIAAQTRLLALNANIEAARAGEAGKGFSVVASNIGELAESAGAAATSIQQVSSEIVSVVKQMSELATSMIEFVGGELTTEFANMTHTGRKYYQDAEKINDVMSKLADHMLVIDNAVGDILAAVEVVTTTTANNSDNITAVSECAMRLNSNMSDTMDMSLENREYADNLENIVEHYTV